MKRELVETVLANIDDKYIEEALNYNKKGSIVSFRKSYKSLTKVAAITLAVIVVGTATAYATYSHLREVKSEENYIYVGEVPTPDMLDDEYVEAVVAEARSNQTIEEKEIVTGDDTVNWLTKSEKNIYQGISDIYENEIKYTYDSYEKVIADTGLDMWFPEIKGDMVSVQYVYREPHSKSRDETLEQLNVVYADMTPVGTIEKRINMEYAYGNGTYLVEECQVNDSKGIDFSMVFDEKVNEREYVNKKGQVFSLVDGTDYDVNDETEESVKRDRLSTYVMICYNEYSGFIIFRDMTENEIHEILDSIQFTLI